MNVTIRYFAGMRDKMGRAQDTVRVTEEAMTVADVWKQASGGQTLPENILIAVNMEYTNGNHVVKNGDEVAFFPPVTGG